MRIFGRETAVQHRNLGSVCSDVTSSSDPNDRAFGWNMIHEQRVNEGWGEYWYHEYGRPLTGLALRDNLIAYHNRIRAQSATAYADLENRAHNFVPVRSAAAPQDTDLLAHVIDLWSPGARVVWHYGFTRGIRGLGSIGAIDRHSRDLPPSLVRILEPGTVEGQLSLMRAFFDAQREFLREVDSRQRSDNPMATLNPFWVTLWDSWQQRVGKSTDDWCASVGLCKDSPVWVAVVRYPVRRVRLIRPTQLEAGWYGRHFPTPPDCSLGEGGRVVDGRPQVFSRTRYQPLKEYLHAPIPLFVEDWIVTLLPCLRTTQPIGQVPFLERDRIGHWNGLTNEFSHTPEWMKRANA